MDLDVVAGKGLEGTSIGRDGSGRRLEGLDPDGDWKGRRLEGMLLLIVSIDVVDDCSD